MQGVAVYEAVGTQRCTIITDVRCSAENTCSLHVNKSLHSLRNLRSQATFTCDPLCTLCCSYPFGFKSFSCRMTAKS